MSQSIDGDDQEEAPAYAAERREDWLDANPADDIDEQQGAEYERDSLRPGNGAPGMQRLRHRVRGARFN